MSIIHPRPSKKLDEPASKEAVSSDDVILALDIGTEYVKAVIAKQDKKNTLKIIGVGRSHQSPSNMYAGAISDIPGVVATCEHALSAAEREAGVVCKTTVVGIAGELIKGNTSTVRYRRRNGNKPITEQEMTTIISRVQNRAEEKARKEVALETDNPNVEVRLINSAIVSLTIDGYKVSNPIGFKGSDLVIQFYTAFAPLVHISAIEKVCAELSLDLLAVAVEPFAVCRACLGDDLDSNFSAIVMDIGGGTTDIAVVDDGGVEGTKMFNLGGRSFTRQIAEKLGTDFDTAESIKLHLDSNLYEDNPTIAEAKKTIDLTKKQQQKVSDAINSNIDVWLGGIELALGEFTNVEMLPGKIYLCGGGAGLPAIPEALAVRDWFSDLPFSRRPVIHLLDDVDIPGIKNATSIDLDYSYITAFGLLRVALDTLAGSEEGTGLRARIAKLLQN